MHFEGLRRLDLCDGTSDEGVRCLQHLPNLVSLGLLSCWRLTDRGLAHVARFAKLEALNVSDCTSITDVGVSTVVRARGSSLTSLSLCYTKITGAALTDVFANLPRLQTLRLAGCQRVVSADVAFSLEHLRVLDMARCRNASASFLGTVLVRAVDLERLDLSECVHVTDAALRGVLAGRKKLQRVRLRQCKHLTRDALSRCRRAWSLKRWTWPSAAASMTKGSDVW